MANWKIDPVNGNTANSGKGWSKVTITSGGTYTIAIGDTITGATSGVTAKVIALTNSSGSFGAGNWAGDLHITEPRLAGAYSAFTNTETLNVGANIDVGTVSSTTRYDSKKQTNDVAAASSNPGDTWDLCQAPQPTSLGNGKWTKKDFEGYSLKRYSVTAATNASPIVCTSNGHGLNVGDYVFCVGDVGNTAFNGIHRISAKDTNTFTLKDTTGNGTSSGTRYAIFINHCVVELAASIAKVVCTPVGAQTFWTVANSGTTGNSATGGKFEIAFLKAGYNTSKGSNSNNRIYIAQPASASANTLYGYAQLGNGSNVDLSAYQIITLWIYTSAVTNAGETGVIKLCSDTAGANAVNTITLPAIPTNAVWHKLEIDNGSALGNNIQSIAYYSGSSAKNSLQVSIGQLVVSKARTSNDSIGLTDLISKNSTHRGTEAWYPIAQFVDGWSDNIVAVVLGSTASTQVYNEVQYIGYQGATETVTTYVLHPQFIGSLVNQSSAIHQFLESGNQTDTTHYKVRGGFDVSTDTIEGETFITGYGQGYGISLQSYLAYRITRVSIVETYNAFSSSGTSPRGIVIEDIHTLAANQYIFASIGLREFKVWNLIMNQTFTIGTVGMEVICFDFIMESSTLMSLSIAKIFKPYTVAQAKIAGGGSNTVPSLLTNVEYNNITFENTGYTYFGIGGGNGDIILRNCIINLSSEFYASSMNARGVIFSENHDQSGNHYMYSYHWQGWVKDQSLGGGEGMALSLEPTKDTCRDIDPADRVIGRYAVKANKQVTITAKVRKTNASNVAGAIGVKSSYLGLTTDNFVECTDNADTWNTVTLQFTPTQAGVIPIFGKAYLKNDSATTTYKVFFDDITYSQVD